MEYRELGSTGYKVSLVGFGGIPIQRIDGAEAKKVVGRALELGINFFDTARGYTDSEEKLGVALKEHRDKVIIATKSMARDREGMAADIEKSLQALGVDCIDLYQMHNIKDEETLEKVLKPDGALAALKEARDQGKIKHIGVTGHIKELLIKVVKTGEVETVQFPFNAVETNGVRELLDLATETGVGAIVMKPLAGGALSNANFALRYLLEYPVSTVIPGMDSVRQVEENAAVGSNPLPLSAAEREELQREVASLGMQFCRRCEYCLPCQQEIDIPSVFLFEGYYTRYGLKEWAVDRYRALKAKPEDCLECGECEERCPYNLPIRRMLKEAAQKLG
jgi:hypothetical protein